MNTTYVAKINGEIGNYTKEEMVAAINAADKVVYNEEMDVVYSADALDINTIYTISKNSNNA